MNSEKLLDLLREGKVPLSFNDSGMPSYAASAPIYELMQFVKALAMGYMRLYNRLQIMEKCRKSDMIAKQVLEELTGMPTMSANDMAAQLIFGNQKGAAS